MMMMKKKKEKRKKKKKNPFFQSFEFIYLFLNPNIDPRYTLPSTLSRRGTSLSGKFHKAVELNGEMGPGPGEYNPSRANDADAPRYSMAKKTPTAEELLRRMNTTPGPGTYGRDNSENLGNTGPKFSLKGKISVKSADNTPGPGAYHAALADPIGADAPAFSLRARVTTHTKETGPGPASYRPASAGAFAYDVIGGVISAPAFLAKPGRARSASPPRTGRRHSSDRGRDGFGGADEWPPSGAVRGPSLGSKWNDPFPTSSLGPGPGAYSPPPPSRPAGITIKGKLRDNAPKDTGPGPGAFDVLQSERATRKKVGFSISGWHSNERRTAAGPGPGTYSVPDLIGV
jgi:hypothetical protein